MLFNSYLYKFFGQKRFYSYFAVSLKKILTLCELPESDKVDLNPEFCCAFCFPKRYPRKPHINTQWPFSLKNDDADKWSLWWARGTTWKWALKVFSDKSLALNKKVNAVITTYNCCSTAALHNSLDLPGCRAVGIGTGGGTLAPSDFYRSVNPIHTS